MAVSRQFCVPGLILLTIALVFGILVSISLPFLTGLDIVRVHFAQGLNSKLTSDSINELRFGIWAFCFDNASTGDRFCSPKGHGYIVQVLAPLSDQIVTIGSSWTRGLAVHPVATAFTFFAFACSFSENVAVALVSSLLSFFAAFLTLIAFAIDIALLAFVRHEMSNLQNARASTSTGPGFWLTFVSLIVLLLSGCTVCLGRHRSRMDGADSYPLANIKIPFLDRFRR